MHTFENIWRKDQLIRHQSGQVRDVNNVVHPVTQFRISIRDSSWKPASSVLSRRLQTDAVSNFTYSDNVVIVNGG